MFRKISNSVGLKAGWRGSKRHKLFTIVVFIVLASLDNSARSVFPPLYAILAREFAIEEAALGFISAISVLVVAITALFWGYWGDQGSRKKLLLYGTLIWSAAMLMTGLARTYSQLLLFQLVTAVGIGCIASVGFSVVSDFISPSRRGLALSFWGLSQGGGGGIGAMLGGLLGAHNWALPFFVIAGAGFSFALLYLFTVEPERGRSEPELARLFASGRRYEHRIRWQDVWLILTRRSNMWLILQAFLATVGYGSLAWMPRLFIARLESAGYSLETATMSGNLFALLFQTGFYFAILAGHLGDRWQRRHPGGRAWFCAVTTWAAIPFQTALLFIPFHNLELPENGEIVAVVSATLVSILTNPWIAGAFMLGLVAVAFSSTDIPNRSAILTDVNLPEHRGTAVGLLSISVGLGLALGNALAGLSFDLFAPVLASPWHYAMSLALFQLLFIPAGLAYYQLSKTTMYDIARVKQTLAERAEII